MCGAALCTHGSAHAPAAAADETMASAATNVLGALKRWKPARVRHAPAHAQRNGRDAPPASNNASNNARLHRGPELAATWRMQVANVDAALHYLPPHVAKTVWTALGDLVVARERAAHGPPTYFSWPPHHTKHPSTSASQAGSAHGVSTSRVRTHTGRIDGSRWISLRLDGVRRWHSKSWARVCAGLCIRLKVWRAAAAGADGVQQGGAPHARQWNPGGEGLLRDVCQGHGGLHGGTHAQVRIMLALVLPPPGVLQSKHKRKRTCKASECATPSLRAASGGGTHAIPAAPAPTEEPCPTVVTVHTARAGVHARVSGTCQQAVVRAAG